MLCPNPKYFFWPLHSWVTTVVDEGWTRIWTRVCSRCGRTVERMKAVDIHHPARKPYFDYGTVVIKEGRKREVQMEDWQEVQTEITANGSCWEQDGRNANQQERSRSAEG